MSYLIELILGFVFIVYSLINLNKDFKKQYNDGIENILNNHIVVHKGKTYEIKELD